MYTSILLFHIKDFIYVKYITEALNCRGFRHSLLLYVPFDVLNISFLFYTCLARTLTAKENTLANVREWPPIIQNLIFFPRAHYLEFHVDRLSQRGDSSAATSRTVESLQIQRRPMNIAQVSSGYFIFRASGQGLGLMNGVKGIDGWTHLPTALPSLSTLLVSKKGGTKGRASAAVRYPPATRVRMRHLGGKDVCMLVAKDLQGTFVAESVRTRSWDIVDWLESGRREARKGSPSVRVELVEQKVKGQTKMIWL